MQIDRYGEVLIGCNDCNRWGHPGDKKLTLEMLEEDLEALRAREPRNIRRISEQFFKFLWRFCHRGPPWACPR